MSRYLEEAANLLRKAADTNETKNARCEKFLNDGRERIAKQFAELAAIDKGLVPSETARRLLDQFERDYA